MKKTIFTSVILAIILLIVQGCKEEDDHHADAHIHGTVVVHNAANDTHAPLANATVHMWFNASSADGVNDFATTTDVTGFFEFEELENGVYFILAFGKDADNIDREGGVLVTLDENNHEAEVEIEAE